MVKVIINNNLYKMETMVTHVIGRRTDGINLVRNFFYNNDKTNYMALAHSYFSKEEKKVAKLNYKKQN